MCCCYNMCKKAKKRDCHERILSTAFPLDFPLHKQKLLVLYCKDALHCGGASHLFGNVFGGNGTYACKYAFLLDTRFERCSNSRVQGIDVPYRLDVLHLHFARHKTVPSGNCGGDTVRRFRCGRRCVGRAKHRRGCGRNKQVISFGTLCLQRAFLCNFRQLHSITDNLF